MRGNLFPPNLPYCGLRSIPACAGEPRLSSSSNSSFRVYPRVCGGTDADIEGPSHEWGLSPRVRGNRRRIPDVGRPEGSIPACAGEPNIQSRKRTFGSVYPRVCGGTPLKDVVVEKETGLSPRVRGNQPEESAPG